MKRRSFLKLIGLAVAVLRLLVEAKPVNMAVAPFKVCENFAVRYAKNLKILCSQRESKLRSCPW